MIGKLKGQLDDIGTDHIILDVQGVGYLVFCSLKVMENLPRKGEALSLYIETIVREDEIKLLGFANKEEQAWFKLLTTVQGVGAKLAIAILGALPISQLSMAIATGDKTTLGRAPGVGPKVAVRLATELKDKIPDYIPTDIKHLHQLEQMPQNPTLSMSKDAISALTNLGYSISMAQSAVAKMIQMHGNDLETAKLIRLALKELSGT